MDSATPSPNLWVGLKYCLIDRNRIGFSSSCKQQRLASWLPSWTFDSAYSSSAWCKNGLCHCLLALHQYLSTCLSVWHTPCSASLMICWFLSRACVSGLHSSPLLVHVPERAERDLCLKDSVRVMTSQTDQEIVFTAQHQNYTWLCVFVCVRENRVDWKQILCVPHSMRCPSVFLLQHAETAGKAVNPQISHEWHIYAGLSHLNRF